MMEVLCAASILRQICPQLCVRVVNVTDLMILATSGLHPHGLTSESFEGLFTKDKCIHFNYVRLGLRGSTDLSLIVINRCFFNF